MIQQHQEQPQQHEAGRQAGEQTNKMENAYRKSEYKLVFTPNIHFNHFESHSMDEFYIIR